jgi:2-amino-4-hydroxy-6-hydroxymethyldihydropteridine diphosphokinase
MEAWIGLGSNLGKPEARLTAALENLGRTEGIEVKRCSGFYRSAPWGFEDQNDFVNAVAVVETTLPPRELMKSLLDIEQQLGRERSEVRWGPRCIDLDLLTYEDLQLESPGLQLPHPRMQLRAFVLQPILELDPDFLIPGVGPAETCLSELEPQHVEYIGSAEDNLAGARVE